MKSVSCELFPAVDAGSWAEWATVGVALLALIAAGAAAVAAWKQNQATLDLLEVEQQRENRAAAAEQRRVDAEERSHQADAVAVWAWWQKGRMGGFQSEVQNNSLLPVYDVRVTFFGPDGQEFPADEAREVAPPGSHQVRMPEAMREQTNLDASVRDPSKPYLTTDFVRGIPASIRFRDTAGKSWHRDRDGYLHPEDGGTST